MTTTTTERTKKTSEREHTGRQNFFLARLTCKFFSLCLALALRLFFPRRTGSSKGGQRARICNWKNAKSPPLQVAVSAIFIFLFPCKLLELLVTWTHQMNQPKWTWHTDKAKWRVKTKIGHNWLCMLTPWYVCDERGVREGDLNVTGSFQLYLRWRERERERERERKSYISCVSEYFTHLSFLKVNTRLSCYRQNELGGLQQKEKQRESEKWIIFSIKHAWCNQVAVNWVQGLKFKLSSNRQTWVCLYLRPGHLLTTRTAAVKKMEGERERQKEQKRVNWRNKLEWKLLDELRLIKVNECQLLANETFVNALIRQERRWLGERRQNV